ncbi:exported hypothetical protein [uncultured Pleomorphomonas sp.]|uniref:Uncharacterized protein n=1 Tax=uncultured Pleomorphomonas sp. TaxID=442121 RepID=A0A212LQQ4_9HYPH|nr:exported hypothetical protein [uncultured Pleomorphomonas sp.]
MSATKKARSKRKVKRAGAKALRSANPPNTYPRRDGATAPATDPAFETKGADHADLHRHS